MAEMTVRDALNLALQHHQAGRLAAAEQLYRQILALEPNNAQSMHFLGVIAQQQGRGDIALELIRRALAINPNLSEAHNNLGTALLQSGDGDQAIAAYRRAIALLPGYFEAHNNLGAALHAKGLFDQAIEAHRKSIALRPDYAKAYADLGAALRSKGQIAEAIAALRASIALQPAVPDVHNNLGVALREVGQFDEAVAAYRQAIALQPEFAQAHSNLGNTLKEQGELDGAITAFRRAIAVDPSLCLAHSNLIYTMYFHPGYDAQGIRAEACRWNELHARAFRSPAAPPAHDADPDRQLCIGYISPNFRQHTNGLAMLPLLKAHDHSAYCIFCYSDAPRADSITAKCRGAVDAWRDICGSSDEQVVQLIRHDRIDILVDLASHMANNRLLVFAQKPAPVQATYLCNQGTTGLSTMDYRISDPHVDPPGVSDDDYTEKTIRLPDCYLCFEPPADSPEVNPLPALQAAHLTFGSLNNFCKVTPAVLQLWSRIMQNIPHSRLILRCPAGDARQRAAQAFKTSGIDPSRLEFFPTWMEEKAYLRLHGRMDIYLDPFPHSGHTTSMDALWMGVPLITLAGKTAAGRGGVFLLANLGLEDLIARSEAEYLARAVALAANLSELARLRTGLRSRMQRSPLMNAAKFARNIEAAYRQMWRSWCDSRPFLSKM